LLKDLDRNGNEGIGKSEPLKYGKVLCERFDEVDRPIYNIKDGMIEIIQCKGHYDDEARMTLAND